MKLKNIFFFLMLVSLHQFSQEVVYDDFEELEKDTVVYNKSTDFIDKKEFKDNLKNKYSGEDFTYTEEEKKQEKKTDSTPTNPAFINGLSYFMSAIFPFLLGGIIILIILKVFLGSETGFWNFNKNPKKVAEKLIYEDEDIHETDLEALLKKAITNKDYRLAIRYYYLISLRELSNKKIIAYHKEKTNSEYIFEIFPSIESYKCQLVFLAFLKSNALPVFYVIGLCYIKDYIS